MDFLVFGLMIMLSPYLNFNQKSIFHTNSISTLNYFLIQKKTPFTIKVKGLIDLSLTRCGFYPQTCFFKPTEGIKMNTIYKVNLTIIIGVDNFFNNFVWIFLR